jgi:hypothetical protein
MAKYDYAGDPDNRRIVPALLRERAALAAGEGNAERVALIDEELEARGHKAAPPSGGADSGKDPRQQPPQGRQARPSSRA